MTPRSSGPGGEYAPLRGTTNLRLTANQHCNVTETALAFSPVPLPQPTGSRLSYRLPGSLLRKQTLSTSRKRRSKGETDLREVVFELKDVSVIDRDVMRFFVRCE